MRKNEGNRARWTGWPSAINDLTQREGTLWLIAPFITALPPENLVAGARVLTTLDPQHLARGASDSQTLRRLIDLGAEVRILPDLHAKAYLRIRGSQAIGFSGSANLTHKGAKRNYEVMTGPEEFSVAFIRDLTQLWAQAEVLTETRFQKAQEQADRLQQNTLTRDQLESDVIVFIIETRLLRGSFELTESKVGIPEAERTPGLRAARVDFVKADYRRAGTAQLQQGLKRLRDGRAGRAVSLGGLAYAVPLADREKFQDRLETLHGELRTSMQQMVNEKYLISG